MINIDIKALSQYLKSIDIKLDITELQIQIESHPNYPSLLSYVDALSYFNINTSIYRIENDEKHLLPDKFIALISEQMYFIIEENGSFYYFENNERVDLKIWDNIIFIINENNSSESRPKKKNIFAFSFYTFFFLFLFSFFLSFIFKQEFYIPRLILGILSFLGLFLSREILNKTYNNQTGFFDAFCNNKTLKTDCEKVIKSKKWKIFDFIDLSTISCVFFSIEIICLIFFSLIGSPHIDFFFKTLKYGLILFLPISLISIYYQVYVIKNWCALCVGIIVTVYTQMIILYFFQFSKAYNISILVLILFISCLTLLLAEKIKSLYLNNQELLITKGRFLKFRKNYAFFKNNLYNQEIHNFSELDLAFSFGNADSKIQLVIITNPFCGFCKTFHPQFSKIISDLHEKIDLKLFFDADIQNLPSEINIIYRKFVAIYLQHGAKSFLDTLSFWHKNNSSEQLINNWHNNTIIEYDINETDSFLKLQKSWCLKNHINFTPKIFIDGYEYPLQYEREDLEFFLLELINEKYS